MVKLKEGLDEYEWRWKTNKFLSQQRHFSQPWGWQTSLKDEKQFSEYKVLWDTIMWSSLITYNFLG